MNQAIRNPKTTRHLEHARQIARGELPSPPVAELIGFNVVEVDVGRSVLDMNASARHANPMGTLHGGVICDLADAAMGVALSSTLEDDETFTTIDLTANFFKPIWNAHLKAVASVTRRTRTLGFIECEVVDDAGSLVAKLFSTCMVLRGSEAKGR